MGTVPDIPANWTKTEGWVWAKIAAGSPADLIEYDPDQTDLVPTTKEGWSEKRRLSSKFLETILTQKAFVEATPYGGVRILGALIDDAPLNLEHACLQHQFCLEKSRILTQVNCRNLRVEGELSLAQCFVSGDVALSEADIQKQVFLVGATFKGELNLGSANIGSHLMMRGATFKGELNLGSANIGSILVMNDATFEGAVNLNRATVEESAFLCAGATFKSELDLGAAKIGSALVMNGATFEGGVNLDRVTIAGSAFLRAGATFKDELNLGSANIGSTLDMDGSTFEGAVILNNARVASSAFFRAGATFKGELDLVGVNIGSSLDMEGSTFEGAVILNSARVASSAFFRAGSTFKSELDLGAAKIGSNLEMNDAMFEGNVNLTGCTVTGTFLLGVSETTSARWKEGASLTLRNTHVGALQGWWRNENANSWPNSYRLEGFTYDRLGSIGGEKEADMLGRPVSSYLQWLNGDPGSSPQPYEHLADRFHEAGEPHKATDILYAARERQRHKAWSTVDNYGHPKKREGLRALGLSMLDVTIGYGLGNRYFRVLQWVGGFTFVGAFVLIFSGSYSLTQWPPIFFASLNQLLPIVTLNKAHDVLIFGDLSAKPPVEAQPYGVLVYFYLHKLLGWVLGSFLVAGFGGLTQRN